MCLRMALKCAFFLHKWLLECGLIAHLFPSWLIKALIGWHWSGCYPLWVFALRFTYKDLWKCYGKSSLGSKYPNQVCHTDFPTVTVGHWKSSWWGVFWTTEVKVSGQQHPSFSALLWGASAVWQSPYCIFRCQWEAKLEWKWGRQAAVQTGLLSSSNCLPFSLQGVASVHHSFQWGRTFLLV